MIARLAWRHVSSRPRQTALTITGVALGVAVFVFTVSMMDGLTIYFSQRLIKISPLLTVMPERLGAIRAREALRRAAGEEVLCLSRPPVPDDRPTIRGALMLARLVREAPGILGASLSASVPVVVSFGTVTEPASLDGIEADQETKVTSLPDALSSGSWHELLRQRDGALIGRDLAGRLGVETGDRIVVTGELGSRRELEVRGILATGLGSVDETSVMVPLPIAQALAGWGSDEASEIRVRSEAVTDLGPLRRRLEAITGHRVETWQERSAASLQLFRTIGRTTYLLTGFVLVVAGLGVANRLTTVILDKEREIAILRSFGFSRAAVRGVFLVEGLLLGGAGAVAGCATAALAIAYFTAFPLRFPARGNGQVMAYTELFLANDIRYYAVITLAALAMAVLAALVAVRRAVRVVPVEVLRGAV